MKKKPAELDWIIEYDTLPAGEPPALDDPPPPRPRRHLPAWVVALGLLLGVALGLLLTLWRAGNRPDPLPPANPVRDQIAAAIDLEISALAAADQELYRPLRDPQLDRQPLPAGARLRPLAIHPLDNQSAWAEIQVDWQGQSGRLVWFYRRDADRWRRAAWLPIDQSPIEVGGSTRVRVRAQELSGDQAAATAAAAEALLADLCATVTCAPRELSLSLDPDSADFYVTAPAPFYYSFPSPLRVRWGLDNRPDPQVLGSFGRHLAYDLLVEPARNRLTPENETALTLASFWLAHHFLGLEPLPATRWLSEAVAFDGLPAARQLISLLATGVPPEAAVQRAFQPATARLMHGRSDYFVWLALVQDPENRLRPQPPDADPLALPWAAPLQVRFDWLADPWARPAAAYDRAAPPVVDLVGRPGWLLARLAGGSPWGQGLFFRAIAPGAAGDASWQLARPDETLLGPPLERPSNVRFLYWGWDARDIEETVAPWWRMLAIVSINFGLVAPPPLDVLVLAAPGELALPDRPADLYLPSPALESLLGHELPSGGVESVWALIAARLGGPPDRGGAALFHGLIATQMAQLQLDYGGPLAPDLLRRLDRWRPAAPGQPAYRPLSQLWTPAGEQPDAETLLQAASLIDYLVVHRGNAALPRCLDALRRASSMDEWAQLAAGQELATLEAAWRAWAAGR